MHTDHQQDHTSNKPASSRLAVKLLITVVAMFGFGFALVPLYDVICDITGLNGKTSGQYQYRVAENAVDTDRLVTVQFMASNNAGMSWEFRPEVKQVKVHPGELTDVIFYARNPESRPMVAQAVPSLSPSQGTDYFHKTECFCFTQQFLDAGEAVDMPLRFLVDRDLPADVTKLTLSYTLFDVTRNFKQAGQNLSRN